MFLLHYFAIVALSQAWGDGGACYCLSCPNLSYSSSSGGRRELMKHPMVHFPQSQTDVNHNQPTKECVNTNPR